MNNITALIISLVVVVVFIGGGLTLMLLLNKRAAAHNKMVLETSPRCLAIVALNDKYSKIFMQCPATRKVCAYVKTLASAVNYN